jgi:hypothetical protein
MRCATSDKRVSLVLVSFSVAAVRDHPHKLNHFYSTYLYLDTTNPDIVL